MKRPGRCGLLAVMLAAGIATACVQGAAPPLSARWLAGELRAAAQTEAKATQAAFRGDFAQALRLSREALAARQRLQTAGRWETVNAAWGVKYWARLERLPQVKHQQVGEGLRKDAQGCLYQSKGQYDRAETSFREALAIFREALGEEHPSTARGYNGVGNSLRQMGKDAAALPLHRKALAIWLKTLGEDDPDTATGYNTVAVCLKGLGKAGEALPLYRKALAIWLKTLGEDHPNTADAYSTVAQCLQSLGKPGEAMPLHLKALEILRKTLGEEHAGTARGYNSVASCLQSLGKPGEALPLYRKTLEIDRKALGEEHPDTSFSYNNVASCLKKLGKPGEALTLYRKALEIQQKVLGEDHPDTARGYNNLASCLNDLGKGGEALLLYRKALTIWQKTLAEDHPRIALSYNNMAYCLQSLGKSGEALLLYRRALAIRRKMLGEDHPDTAVGYNNVAACLQSLGKPGEALPLFRQSLEITRKALGENHPDAALGYSNVAFCLQSLGKPAEALPLYRKALQLRENTFGKEHPEVAAGANNVAYCLHGLRKLGEALPMHRRALAIWRKTRGEDHPDTARSYANVASTLQGLGKPGEALAMHRKALEVWQKTRGVDHPDTALGCNNAAYCLQVLGKPGEALPLFRQSLAIRQTMLGEEHPLTALSYRNAAYCLNALDKPGEAVRHLRLALLGLDVGRQSAASASAGFDRSLFTATQAHARPLLACLLAAEGKPSEAWRFAEAHLGRGLLESLIAASPAGAAEDARRGELTRLDALIVSQVSAEKLTLDQEQRRDSLVRERRKLLAQMARAAADRLDKRIWSLQDVQKRLRGDDAVLFWLDVENQHWGCVLRRDGEPRWARLPGSGKAGAWTVQDGQLPGAVHAVVRQAHTSDNEVRRLIGSLRRQRLAPLEKHLKAEGKLPAVRRLIVVPVGKMAAVPMEVLAPEFIVSYAPSATLFARAVQQGRTVQLTPFVALGDPVFDREKRTPPPAPEYGILLTQVLPGGNAARAGLRAGDVLLRYNNVRLRSLSDFKGVTADVPVKAIIWRDGETIAVRLRPGPLHVRIDNQPVAKALEAWRETEALTRGSEEAFARLPGTRFEVEAVARLVGGPSTLLRGSAASEQEIDRLLRAGTLQKARVIHLATHGRIDLLRPEYSALVLSRDALPDAVEQSRQGLKAYNGYLRVSTILSEWNLDADLVVLSACQTGLGQDGGGEGLLGFAQAFLQKGARSVVLSRWKVDDSATALLMLRFYENLLGKREDLKQPLGRAKALHEAKKWLASLERDQAMRLAGGLLSGEVRGTVKKLKPPSTKADKAVKLPDGERPFAHPAFWAAFVLVGEAN